MGLKHRLGPFCVDDIVTRDGWSVGVCFKRKVKIIFQLNKFIISNLLVWGLLKIGITDNNAFPGKFVKERMDTPVGNSCVHLCCI